MAASIAHTSRALQLHDLLRRPARKAKTNQPALKTVVQKYHFPMVGWSNAVPAWPRHQVLWDNLPLSTYNGTPRASSHSHSVNAAGKTSRTAAQTPRMNVFERRSRSVSFIS